MNVDRLTVMDIESLRRLHEAAIADAPEEHEARTVHHAAQARISFIESHVESLFDHMGDDAVHTRRLGPFFEKQGILSLGMLDDDGLVQGRARVREQRYVETVASSVARRWLRSDLVTYAYEPGELHAVDVSLSSVSEGLELPLARVRWVVGQTDEATISTLEQYVDFAESRQRLPFEIV